MVCENIFTAPPRPMVRNGAFSHKIDFITIFYISKDIKIALGAVHILRHHPKGGVLSSKYDNG